MPTEPAVPTEPTTVLVSGVVNRTHLVYVASWLREQRRQGRPVGSVGVVAPGAFLGEVRVTAAETVAILGEVVAGPVETDVGPQWVATASESRALTYVCVGAPALRLVLPALRAARRRPHVVVVDEGIGSYGGRRTRTAAFRRNGASPVWAATRAAAVSSGRAVLTSEDWPTYWHRQGGWELNPAVGSEFCRRARGAPAPPGTAVMLAQPWPALGVMSADAYREHLAAVEALCRQSGLRLELRLHPADSAERYQGLPVSASTTPAELDRGVIEADLVLGASSTALLNLAAIYGTRCVRVRPPELDALERRLGARQRSLLDAYLPATRTPAELRASGVLG